MGDDLTTGLDDTQVKLLEEECILVDEYDENIGCASKKTCHMLKNINNGMLHRAFSLFLFNTQGELLLQQRANEKITFPAHWTNTCCSHPLNFPAELDEIDAHGVKVAARRKVEHELGIPPEQISLDDMHYLTRVQYKSDNVPHDGKWGEHEIDYMLILRTDVTLDPNENEVQNTEYVSQERLRQIMEDSKYNGTLITPWFRLVVENFLFKWWNNLDDLEPYKDHRNIHRKV